MTWADKFNLLNGLVILRLTVALHFIPHVVGKFTEPATLGFFKAAKFNPPHVWMYVAGTIETVRTLLLIFDVYTPYDALIVPAPSPLIRLIVRGRSPAAISPAPRPGHRPRGTWAPPQRSPALPDPTDSAPPAPGQPQPCRSPDDRRTHRP